MAPHENLETKRRHNIVELNRSGACHLCGCTSGSRSYSRFVPSSNDEGGSVELEEEEEEEAASGEEGLVPPREIIPMRTCMCYGNASSSPRPFPLRVCEMCIADDVRSVTGRIRCCGICGVVACDEDCGVQGVSLIEVTDGDEWNNAGCIECRGMESFFEMELFRAAHRREGVPRITRVCTGCAELFTLWSYGTRYTFSCRYFKCDRLLLPSSIVELKRCMTPFPLNELPDELLNPIVDFLGGRDLFSFGLVCTKIFRKVEDVSRDFVTRFNHQLPTGPCKIVPPSHGKEATRRVVYAEGKNTQSLCPPGDGKTWVGVLNQMEQLTRSIFYFDFQITSGDDGAPMRYLRKPDKLSFDRAYSKPLGTGEIVPYSNTDGLLIRGGQILVNRYKLLPVHGLDPTLPMIINRNNRNRNIGHVLFSTNRSLVSGMHRVIIWYNCFCHGASLGSIGILRQQEGGSVAFQTSWKISNMSPEERVFGMEYDADRRVLKIYEKDAKTNKMELNPSTGTMDVVNKGGELCFAASFSRESVGIKGNQLSIRSCDEDEWSAFLSHKVERSVLPRIQRRVAAGQRGEERLWRYLDHRARRAMAGNDDGDVAAMIQIERMINMVEREIELDDADSDLEREDIDFEHDMILEDEMIMDRMALEMNIDLEDGMNNVEDVPPPPADPAAEENL